MTSIDPTSTLGDLVVDVPRRAMLFERLRLDYCCGGEQSLEDACARRDLDPATVVALLAAFDDTGSSRDDEPHDVSRASIAELCDHIVVAHHDTMRRELPRLCDLLATVVRVHQVQRPELLDLRRVFDGLRGDLERHMALEEAAVFPACRAAEVDCDAGVDEGLLAAHEAEHEEVGEALAALRELSGGYEAKRALCGTHRLLLEGLRDLELDLHQHVHEENNILFPRVRALAAAAD